MTAKFYAFDGIDERLELLPLAARRALDRAGLKLSLKAWQGLPHTARQRLAELGSEHDVDAKGVAHIVAGSAIPAETMEPMADPPSDSVPELVESAFGPERGISPSIWTALSPLDRYSLQKVASRGNPERIAAAYAEIIGNSELSPHLAPGGGVRMVSVSNKPESLRRAQAESYVTMNANAFERLTRRQVPKGDVLATARLAGILAAKKTGDLVPLCHPLPLTHVGIELELLPDENRVRVLSTVEVFGRTGVEMEALVAASAAGLTIYDMLKAFDKGMSLGPTRLLSKSGGRSGDFRADTAADEE